MWAIDPRIWHKYKFYNQNKNKDNATAQNVHKLDHLGYSLMSLWTVIIQLWVYIEGHSIKHLDQSLLPLP